MEYKFVFLLDGRTRIMKWCWYWWWGILWRQFAIHEEIHSNFIATHFQSFPCLICWFLFKWLLVSNGENFKRFCGPQIISVDLLNFFRVCLTTFEVHHLVIKKFHVLPAYNHESSKKASKHFQKVIILMSS